MVKVFLDLDGVLVNFVKGACERHDRPNPYEGPDPDIRFEMDEIWGMTPWQFWKPLNSYEFWSKLSWTSDGLNLLDMIEKKFGERNICLLSSPHNHFASGGKHLWIEKHLPQYRKQFFLGAAKEFGAGPNKLLIDDKDSNVSSFIQHRGSAILVPRPWNMNRGFDTLGYMYEAFRNHG